MARNDQSTVQESFGANLRRRRLSLGLTQADVADEAGLEHESYRAIERGRAAPSFKRIIALANALDVEVVVLFKKAKLPKGKVGRPKKKRK